MDTASVDTANINIYGLTYATVKVILPTTRRYYISIGDTSAVGSWVVLSATSLLLLSHIQDTHYSTPKCALRLASKLKTA